MAIIAVNIPGTSDETARSVCGCRSWVAHWRIHSGSRRWTCMSIGCTNEAAVGAHVRKPRGRKPWIIGLCRSCNHHSNNEQFEVDERSQWAPVAYVQRCGDLPDLSPGDIVKRSPTAQEELTLVEFVSQDPDADTATWAVLTERGSQNVTLHGDKVRRIRRARQD